MMLVLPLQYNEYLNIQFFQQKSFSLGDLALKPSPLTAQPEVAKIQLTGSEACMILASDGLFDGHDWDEVGQLVRDYLKQRPIEGKLNL